MKIKLIKKIQSPKGLIDEVTVLRVIDSPAQKRASVFFKELPNALVLWKNAEYDIAGQWTDESVKNRIIELLSK
jgi:hypothetical protein